MKLTLSLASIAVAISLGSVAEAACSSKYGQCGGKEILNHILEQCN